MTVNGADRGDSMRRLVKFNCLALPWHARCSYHVMRHVGCHSRIERHIVSGVAAAALATGVAVSPRDAWACSGTSAGNDFAVPEEVPQNAKLLGTYTCQFRTTCSFPQTLEVLNAAGQPVPGNLTISVHPKGSGALYIFEPAEPWTLGETYTVTDLATAPLAPRASTFSVVQAVVLDAGRVASQLGVAGTLTSVSEVCCDELPDSCGFPYCVALESEVELGLHMYVQVPTEHRLQWLSRLHVADGEEGAVADAVSPWGYPMLSIIEQRSTYCARVELLSLVDGTTVLKEEQCVEGSTAPTMGRVTNDLMASALDIAQCKYPRPEFREAWCAGTAARCAAGWPEDACASHDEHCSAADAAGCTLLQDARSTHVIHWSLLTLAAAMIAAGWRRAQRGPRH